MTRKPTVPDSTPARSGLAGLDAYRVAVEFYRHLRQGVTAHERGPGIASGSQFDVNV